MTARVQDGVALTPRLFFDEPSGRYAPADEGIRRLELRQADGRRLMNPAILSAASPSWKGRVQIEKPPTGDSCLYADNRGRLPRPSTLYRLQLVGRAMSNTYGTLPSVVMQTTLSPPFFVKSKRPGNVVNMEPPPLPFGMPEVRADMGADVVLVRHPP
ncbi:hypothetical protein EON62_06465, partial [archaeon]